MGLEATMLVVDNSESSRNGDYVPSRWDAQADAVNMIFTAKTQANPESSVGLMSMGGKGPEVLVTLTTDLGKILDGMHRTKIHGHAHLATGIKIAGLALKHRQNKAQHQRIIVFTCSDIHEGEPELIKLAKAMKKTNVSVDFVTFGDLSSAKTRKLEAFVDNVKSGDGSYLAVIPPGPQLISDQLVSTPILGGDGTARPANGAGEGTDTGGGDGYEFGVDPTQDPELALALRMSMEEERARQEREEKAKAAADKDKMEGIPEESEPLLDKDGGHASGSKEHKDDDKMDTA